MLFNRGGNGRLDGSDVYNFSGWFQIKGDVIANNNDSKDWFMRFSFVGIIGGNGNCSHTMAPVKTVQRDSAKNRKLFSC
jgi:hypothetical protein